MAEIQIRKVCFKCHGCGLQQSPAWEDYWHNVQAGNDPDEPNEPEEVTCCDCYGDGYIYQWTRCADEVWKPITHAPDKEKEGD